MIKSNLMIESNLMCKSESKMSAVFKFHAASFVFTDFSLKTTHKLHNDRHQHTTVTKTEQSFVNSLYMSTYCQANNIRISTEFPQVSFIFDSLKILSS